VSEVLNNLIDLASPTDSWHWMGCAAFSGSQKIQRIIVVASFFRDNSPIVLGHSQLFVFSHSWVHSPERLQIPCTKGKNSLCEIDSGWSPACAHLPWAVSLSGCLRTALNRAEKMHSIFALCQHPQASKGHQSIQICLFLSSSSSCKEGGLWGGVWGQHHLRIWFWRQSTPGLNLWFPHAGMTAWSCCNTTIVLGCHFWLLVPFCNFSN